MTAYNSSDGRGQSKLCHVIRRFAEAPPALSRDWTVPTNEVDKLMLAIFREIDETVLPREISMSTDSGVSARLLISNRRLICLDIDDTIEPAETDTPSDPEEAANMYVRQLQNVFKRSGEIRVRLSERGTATASENISCSAHSLAASVGLPLNETNRDRLVDFSDKMEPLALARLRTQRDGDNADVHGSDEHVELLTELAARQPSDPGNSRLNDTIRSTRPLCRLLPVNSAISIVRATDNDQSALFVVPSDKTQSAVAEWHKIYSAGQ